MLGLSCKNTFISQIFDFFEFESLTLSFLVSATKNWFQIR